jgi:gamma-glutamyltranspeptidase/glutathione hydrolase
MKSCSAIADIVVTKMQFSQPANTVISAKAAIKKFLLLLAPLLLINSSTFAGALPKELIYSSVTPDGRGAAATVNPIATRAALDAFNKGGNAIDAAVAAAMTLGVVDGHNSGIGGGCFAVVRWANGKIEAIDGREMAPAAAFRDMYLEDGKYNPSLSKTGALAVGIPGSVAAYDYLQTLGGELSWKELVLPAADIAEQGFAIAGSMAQRLERSAERIALFPATRAVFLDERGEPWPKGHILKQPDLAESYRKLALEGASWFYEGKFAEATAQWMEKNNGIITTDDFAGYKLLSRKALVSSYRGYMLAGFPPPSSGGVIVAEILNILENFDLASMADGQRQHIIAEAMKLAFADRAYWLGDPDYARVPRGLTDKAYASQLADRINPDRATKVNSYSTPPNAETDLFGKHTTHIATADKDGNWVAITTTVNTSFGSKVVIPGTGVILNNQMDDFSAQPGRPNAFGLIGKEANRIEPGKRPLSSMSPTVVLHEGRPVMTLGAAGGPTIISQVVQAIVNTVDLGMPLEQAIAAPRIHHQWHPNTLFVEPAMSFEVDSVLFSKGHPMKDMRPFGSTQAIALDKEGNFVAVSEPRMKERDSQ